MGLFGRFREKNDAHQRGAYAVQEEPGYSKNLVDVLSAYIGRARLHQVAFYRNVLKGKDWTVDFQKGLIWFGEDSYPIQLLGSESSETSSWLWAIENVNGFPDDLIKDAFLFYNSALMENMPELKMPQFQLSTIANGHNISSIASAAHYEKTVYYRCPYEGGAAFVLVKGAPEAVFQPARLSEAVVLITDLIKQLPLNHKILSKNVLMDSCVSVEGGANTLIGHFDGGMALSLEFDINGKLSNMQALSE